MLCVYLYKYIVILRYSNIDYINIILFKYRDIVIYGYINIKI